MTRRKLNRIRRAYNAYRRVNRGWTPISWDWLVDRFEADTKQLSALERAIKRGYR